MAKNATPSQAITLLIDAGKTDTVYRDVYLRRARELLSPTLDDSGYRAIGSMQKDADELVRRTRSAVLQHDWAQASELSAQADQKRKAIDAQAGTIALAKDVYEADMVAFDPFSPGKHLGPHAQAMQSGLRAQLIETLTSLGKVDATFGAFYEQRRGYFSGLELASSADSTKTHSRSRLELEQLALEAAERGDITAIQSIAKELRDYKDGGEKTGATSSVAKGRYECPLDLESPFPTDVSARAQELGMAEHHFAARSEMRAAVEDLYPCVGPDTDSSGIGARRSASHPGLSRVKISRTVLNRGIQSARCTIHSADFRQFRWGSLPSVHLSGNGID
jgi:hypothetical protein